METILLNALAGNYRRETVNGREFIVAPLVSIVPGVLNGSKGALFYPEDEIARDPQAWNGMPLVKGHPTKNGQHISGRDPWVRANLQMGTIYNSVYDGKLQHEAWFDVEDTKRVDNWVYQQLITNRPIEVSTGLFTDNEPNQGTYNGRTYDYVARNYRPDHMAILVGQRGACSNRDGCGININSGFESDEQREAFFGIMKGGDKGSSREDALKKAYESTVTQLGGRTWDKALKDWTGAGGTKEEFIKDIEKIHGPIADLQTKHTTKNVETKSLWTRLGELLGLTSNESCCEGKEEDEKCENCKALNAGVYGNPQSTATGKFKRHGAGTGKGDVHEAAQRGAITLSDEDRQRGEMCKSDLVNGGHNPASWVADEDTWEKAKAAADKGEYGDDEYWAVVSHIYKRMGGETKDSTDNSNPEGCNQYKDCGGEVGGIKEEAEKLGGVGDHTILEKKLDDHLNTLDKKSMFDLAKKLGVIKTLRNKEDAREAIKRVVFEKKRNAELIAHSEGGAANSRNDDLIDCQQDCDEDDMDCVDDCLADFISNSNTGETMATPTREQAINQLVTNCDCWKGKQEVLANKDSFTDEDIQKLLKDFSARKLAVNTLREIGVATGAPATLTVNEMPAFIKAKMGKGDNEEEEQTPDNEEEEGEESMMNKSTKNAAKKPAPITERLSPDELEVWNNAVQITANEKKKIVKQLVANLEGDYRKEKYTKLMKKSMDDLREMLELRGTYNAEREHEEAFISNGIGGFFTPDFDDSISTNDRTDNAEDGEPLGLPSSYASK